MQCDQALELIAQPEEINRNHRRQLALHLDSCTSCSLQAQTLEAWTQKTRHWIDAEPPDWQRVPFVMRKGPSRLRRWFPLMAAAVLLLTVLLNADIHIDGSGVLISIGSPETGVSDEDLQALRSKLTGFIAQLERDQKNQLASMMAGIDVREKSNEHRVREWINLGSLEQKKAIDDMLISWQQQRKMDLQVLQAGFEALSRNQETNNSNLVNLAQFVQTTPRKRS